eukprot:171560_1
MTVLHHCLSNYSTFHRDTLLILQALLEELEVKNILIEWMLVGSGNRIDYLLKQLMLQKTRIHDSNSFWKQVGQTINMSPKLMLTLLKHPLLLEKTEYKKRHQNDYKTILERLVEELEINSILQEYLSVDSEVRINYFVKQLMLQKKTIRERNVFWKQLGNTISNNEQFLSIVENLLSKLKHDGNKIKTKMLVRLVEEIFMSSITFRKIEYLCHRLYSKKETITNKNTFWREIGFTVDEHDRDLITIISSHPLLVKHSQYETIEHTILYRFVEELQIHSILQE